MNIKFNGDISELIAGIIEIANELNISIGEGEYEINVIQKNRSALRVSLSGASGTIVYDKKHHFFRAFGLLIENIRSGKQSFNIKETPYFRMNGPMFDVSQGNAAFNITTLKHIICQLSLMGLNTLMLYTEDTFEVKSQPYFGYMRSRYTENELRELDEYAFNLGIEMIPCIQTLAHLQDPLRWKYYKEIRDYDACLLVGEEKTYQFLRDIISAATRPFRSKKIHIGMDEAFKLGTGEYLKRFGHTDSNFIMRQHLTGVMKIINELGLEPMMWDDMFFRTFGKKVYYQYGATVPEETKALVPRKMRTVFWDYRHTDVKDYEEFISQHLSLNKKMIFAGGIYSWMSYSLSWSKTKNAADAALTTCKKLGIKDVFVTTWGDHGTECLINTTLIGCQLYAEHGYSEFVDKDKFAKRFKFCTGGNVEDFVKLEYLDRTPQTDGLPTPEYYNTSKYLMWQDILTGLIDKNIEGYELDEHYKKLSESLKEAIGRNGQFDSMFEFSYHAANVLSQKAQMGLRITQAYKAGDKESLKVFAKEELPELKNRVITLRKIHMDNWFSLYKAFGWDVMDMRYGALIYRITSAIEEIESFLSGKLSRIEELEEPRRYFDGIEGPVRWLNDYHRIVSASRIDAQA